MKLTAIGSKNVVLKSGKGTECMPFKVPFMLPLSYLYFTFHTPFSFLPGTFYSPFSHRSVPLVTFQLPFIHLSVTFIHLSVTFESPFSYLSFTDQLPFSYFSVDSQNGTVSSCIVTRYIA